MPPEFCSFWVYPNRTCQYVSIVLSRPPKTSHRMKYQGHIMLEGRKTHSPNHPIRHPRIQFRNRSRNNRSPLTITPGHNRGLGTFLVCHLEQPNRLVNGSLACASRLRIRGQISAIRAADTLHPHSVGAVGLLQGAGYSRAGGATLFVSEMG